MTDFNEFEVWFVTGSRHLYGEKALSEVADHSQKIAEALTRLVVSSGCGLGEIGTNDLAVTSSTS